MQLGPLWKSPFFLKKKRPFVPTLSFLLQELYLFKNLLGGTLSKPFWKHKYAALTAPPQSVLSLALSKELSGFIR